MAKQAKIPSLQDLNANSPNYVVQLDAGFERIKELLSLLSTEVQDFTNNSYDEFLSQIKSVPGAVSIGQLEHEIKIGSGHLKANFEEVGVRTLEASRKIEDLAISHERRIQPKINEFQDRYRVLQRSFEDFYKELCELTSVTGLVTSHPSKFVQFYAVVGKEKTVYEAYLDFRASNESTFSQPHIHPSLKPEAFTDAAFISSLRTSSEKIQASAYLLENSSRTLPVEAVFAKGGDVWKKDHQEYEKRQSQEKRERQEQAKISPLTQMASSEFFRRGLSQ